MPSCEILDVNENSCANFSLIYVEEGPNSSVCSEGINDDSELGEILFEGHALIDSGDRAAGVQKETGMCQLSSFGTILIGNEFEQIFNLHLAMHDVIEEGLVIVNPRQVFAQNGGGGVTNTSLPVRGAVWSLLGVTWVGLQVCEDVLKLLVEGLVVSVSRNQVVSYVVDRGLKFETVFAKFVDLICHERNVRLVVEVDGLFLLTLLHFDFRIQGLLGLGCSCPSLRRRRCCRFGSTRFLGRHDERAIVG